MLQAIKIIILGALLVSPILGQRSLKSDWWWTWEVGADAGTSSLPDTSFALNDSTGFAADSVNFGQDSSKTWNVTASNVTWVVDLTDSTQAALSSTASSFIFNFVPTIAGAYTDSVQLITSLDDTLYLGATGTGVDTASGTAEWSNPAGNFVNTNPTNNADYGFENNNAVADVWFENGDANTVESSNSTTPIRGSYSCNVVSTVDFSFKVFVTCDTSPAVSTASEMKITVRNNDGSNDIWISIIQIGDGLQNPEPDITISAGTSQDITFNKTSAGDAFGSVGIVINGTASMDFDIDSWSLTQ